MIKQFLFIKIMNKNTIIGLIIITVGLFTLIMFLKPQSTLDNGASISNPTNSGQIKAEETFFDFGTISMAAGKVSHMFKIKNSGSGNAEISKIYTSCMCTSASLVRDSGRKGPFGMPGHGFIPKINESLNLNEEATIEVVFDPAAHGPAGVGKIERLITVEVENGSPVELTFSAFVTP